MAMAMATPMLLLLFQLLGIASRILGLSASRIAGFSWRTSSRAQRSSTLSETTDAAAAVSLVGPAPEGVWVPPSQNSAQRRGRLFSIDHPKDLLDFIVDDDRLSVVKVYASWCVTCKKFDSRYRKIANQYGDSYSYDESGMQVTCRGIIRFAEMQYDNNDNKEVCRDVLGIKNFPYILMYKGSEGKVDGFHCPPTEFQRLVDAVKKHTKQGEEIQHRREPQYGIYDGKLWDLDAKKEVYSKWDPRQPRSTLNFNPFETFGGNSCDASGFYPGEQFYKEPIRCEVSYAMMLAEKSDANERDANPKYGSEKGCPGCKA